jgi:tetratricopeptide (TPR) repeat protein
MKQKTKWILSISAILTISVLLNAGALAQSPKDWSQCIGREGPIIDVVIEGCTAIIQAGQDPPKKLATAFDNRGIAYRLKGEYDRALRDYEQAIRLNPSSANPYNNRGVIYRIKGDYDRAIADYDEAILVEEWRLSCRILQSSLGLFRQR